MREALFAVDCFNTPDIKKGVDADAQVLRNMLMARRDCHVTNGIGFELSRYRFTDIESSASVIENELREHCLKYLPEIYIDKLNIKRRSSKQLLIAISIVNKDSGKQKSVFLNMTEDIPSKLLLDIIQK